MHAAIRSRNVRAAGCISPVRDHGVRGVHGEVQRYQQRQNALRKALCPVDAVLGKNQTLGLRVRESDDAPSGSKASMAETPDGLLLAPPAATRARAPHRCAVPWGIEGETGTLRADYGSLAARHASASAAGGRPGPAPALPKADSRGSVPRPLVHWRKLELSQMAACVPRQVDYIREILFRRRR